MQFCPLGQIFASGSGDIYHTMVECDNQQCEPFPIAAEMQNSSVHKQFNDLYPICNKDLVGC